MSVGERELENLVERWAPDADAGTDGLTWRPFACLEQMVRVSEPENTVRMASGLLVVKAGRELVSVSRCADGMVIL